MLDFHLIRPSDAHKVSQFVTQASNCLPWPYRSPQPSNGGANNSSEDVTNLQPESLDALSEKEVWKLFQNAKTLEEYQTLAGRLDELQAHNEWKAGSECVEPDYDPFIIEEHIEKLAYATATSDLGALQYLLRTSLSRDIGSMNRQCMYKHSWSGTKELTDRYINVVLEAIDKLAHAAVEFKLSQSEVEFYLHSLEESLKYFGRSALALSGGAKMGMKHIGVVKSLWEADVLPDIISGASAGSIVAAVTCVSNDEEMRKTLDLFPYSDLACFDPPKTTTFGWWRERISTFSNTWRWFQMTNMERVMKTWLGDMTFREAHNKTGRILNISVSSLTEEEPQLLNYVTAPDVLIWSAVCASCSVPGLFMGAKLYEKDPETKETKVWMQANNFYVDGSLDQDLPMRKISEMFNVNFFIVAQVNPHVRCFVDCLSPEIPFTGSRSAGYSLRANLCGLCWFGLRELSQRCLTCVQHMEEMRTGGILLRTASLLSQQYTGNINILPKIHYMSDWLNMLSNPTPEYMSRATEDGEKAAWPKIWRLKNCMAVELGLLRAVHLLRERVHFGPEARAARHAERDTKRGRSFSIRGQRPDFLRQRSLSREHYAMNGIASLSRYVSDPPTPSPTFRRNLSLSQISVPYFSMHGNRSQTPALSPQVGVDQLMQHGMLDNALEMTRVNGED